MELDKIYNIDCRQGLQELADESIDLIASDIPYKLVGGGCSEGNYKTSKGHSQPSGTLNRQRTKHESLSGTLNDQVEAVRQGKMFEHNDIEFSEYMPELYRVLKKGTHCYLMINSRNLNDLWNEAIKVGFEFQNLLIWEKNNATPNKYYMQGAEFILLLSKRPARNINDMGMSNILKAPNIIGNKQHPTQKPVSLMRAMVSQSTNKGDIVLDPFAGSGSTLLAAQQLERHYIGFEIDKKYYDIAYKRLFQEPKQQELFIL